MAHFIVKNDFAGAIGQRRGRPVLPAPSAPALRIGLNHLIHSPLPSILQKVSFCTAKGVLLACERCPFVMQKDTFHKTTGNSGVSHGTFVKEKYKPGDRSHGHLSARRQHGKCPRPATGKPPATRPIVHFRHLCSNFQAVFWRSDFFFLPLPLLFIVIPWTTTRHSTTTR